MNIDFQALRQALAGGGAPATQGMGRFNVDQSLTPPPQAPQQPQGLQQKLAGAQGPWQKFNAYAGDPGIQNAAASLAKILQAKGRFAGPRGTDAAMQTALQMPIGARQMQLFSRNSRCDSLWFSRLGSLSRQLRQELRVCLRCQALE